MTFRPNGRNGSLQRYQFAGKTLFGDAPADVTQFWSRLDSALRDKTLRGEEGALWVYLVVFGRYPTVEEIKDGAYLLSYKSSAKLAEKLAGSSEARRLQRSEVAVELGSTSPDAFYVDVSHTSVYHRISGIQRVVRYFSRQLKDSGRPVQYYAFRNEDLRPSFLTPDELAHFLEWDRRRDALIAPPLLQRIREKIALMPFFARKGYHKAIHPLIFMIDEILRRVADLLPIGGGLVRGLARGIRWLFVEKIFLRSPLDRINGSPLRQRPTRIVVPVFNGARNIHLPELAAELTRIDFYLVMRRLNPATHLSMILYDFIPLFYPEFATFHKGYLDYLRVLRVMDHISCISEDVAQQARKILQAIRPEERPRIEAHDLPGTLEVLDDPAPPMDTGGKPLILCVGNIEIRKNQSTILRAAGLLAKRGLQFRLVFAGNYGWLNDRFLIEYGELRRKGGDVELHYSVPERALRQLYRDCAFTVFCSQVEGFGLPILESLSYGKPAVVSDRGSMADIAARAGGCRTVDPLNVEAVADAMAELLSPERRAQLAREIRLQDWPDWQKYTDRVYDFVVHG